MQVQIVSSDTVEATDSSGAKIKGTWNLVFEQALVVELENGMRYVANMRYNFKSEVKSAGAVGNLSTHDKSMFD